MITNQSPSPARRRRFLQHLASFGGVEKPKLPPTPVIVRWNTWFKAAIYHCDHFEFYRSFIANERLFETDTDALLQIDLLLEDYEGLQQEVLFVRNTSRTIFVNLLEFEENNFLSTEVYDKLNRLRIQLESFNQNIDENNNKLIGPRN